MKLHDVVGVCLIVGVLLLSVSRLCSGNESDHEYSSSSAADQYDDDDDDDVDVTNQHQQPDDTAAVARQQWINRERLQL